MQGLVAYSNDSDDSDSADLRHANTSIASSSRYNGESQGRETGNNLNKSNSSPSASSPIRKRRRNEGHGGGQLHNGKPTEEGRGILKGNFVMNTRHHETHGSYDPSDKAPSKPSKLINASPSRAGTPYSAQTASSSQLPIPLPKPSSTTAPTTNTSSPTAAHQRPNPAHPPSFQAKTAKHISGLRLNPSSSSAKTSPSRLDLNTIRNGDEKNGREGNRQTSEDGKEDRKGRGSSRSRSTSLRLNDQGKYTVGGDADELQGLTENEIFRKVTRPKEIEGLRDWGLPEAVTSGCDPALEVKVKSFLKLKLEKGQHINTTLLSSSAFANPHIYTKLVEFVDIDERGTAYPGAGGWLTRQSLENRIADWGPEAIAKDQAAADKAREDAQKAGMRGKIAFASSSSARGSGRSHSIGGGDYPLLLPGGLPLPSGSGRSSEKDRGKGSSGSSFGLGRSRGDRDKERHSDRVGRKQL